MNLVWEGPFNWGPCQSYLLHSLGAGWNPLQVLDIQSWIQHSGSSEGTSLSVRQWGFFSILQTRTNRVPSRLLVQSLLWPMKRVLKSRCCKRFRQTTNEIAVRFRMATAIWATAIFAATLTATWIWTSFERSKAISSSKRVVRTMATWTWAILMPHQATILVKVLPSSRAFSMRRRWCLTTLNDELAKP